MKYTLRQIRDFLKNKYKRDPNQYPRRRVLSLEVQASPGVKGLMFKAIMQGTAKSHETSIQFNEIEFSDKPTLLTKDSMMYRGDKIYFMTPGTDAHPVKCKCTCESSRFEFEYPMFKVKALVGNWRRYKRKTPPGVRPENAKNPNPIGRDFKNPDNVPGYCLHIHNLAVALIKSGRLKP